MIRHPSIVPAFALVLAGEAETQARRPAGPATAQNANIIYVMLDDAGYADFGAFGSKHVETPTFDRVCREGVRFIRDEKTVVFYTSDNGPNTSTQARPVRSCGRWSTSCRWRASWPGLRSLRARAKEEPVKER